MCRTESSTTLSKRQELTRLTVEQSALVTSAEAKKPTSFTYTLSVPSSALVRCCWCGQIVARCILASGAEQNLDLELEFENDPDTQRATVTDARGILTSPHTCLPADRYALAEPERDAE